MYISNRKGILLLLTALHLQLLPGFCVWASATDNTKAAAIIEPMSIEKDIRVVIDMSGSMKKNDPRNHRTKAVQLFSEILPMNISSGIWTFASEVNMLVKHQKVNKSWKETAFKKAKKIHSYGLYTNIEKALKVSTRDLYKNEPLREKHIILLTDGYIDISKDVSINKASRQRVISELIPRLRKNGIIIHSIALSDQADHELLKTLSNKTGGRYAVIENASDLDRYFFNLFESTTRPDTVPLKSNRFEIDKSVNDMTIVLFNSNNPTELLTPEKKKLTHDNHPNTVKWVKSDNYEIITVSSPAVGSWYVDAPIDPDNKIMVVTNLRLHVNKLPTLVLPGESLDIKAFLTEKEKVITKNEFIKLMDVSSYLKKKDGLARMSLKTEYKYNGIFTAQADTGNLEDQNTLVITARSPTFVREYQHDFTVVVNPVILESKLINNNGISVLAYIDDRALDKDQIKIFIENEQDKMELQRIGVKWQVDLPESYSGKKLAIKVDAHLHNGKAYEKTIDITLPVIKKKILEDKKPEIIETKKVEPVSHKDEPLNTKDELPAHDNISDEDSSLNWILVSISVLLLNIILFAGGYFIYKKIFKSGKDDDYLLLDTQEFKTSGNKQQAQDTGEENMENAIEGLEDMEDIEDLDDVDLGKTNAT